MKQMRRHFTYANVMSSIAVFLILGGATAMAAKVGTGQLKAGSVKTGKIAKEAVKAGKLAANAVTTPKVANAAITAEKLADGSVTSTKLANGAVTSEKLAVGAVNRTSLAESKFIPRAFAFVNDSGSVNPALTDGIPNATNPSAGIYCFDLSFSPIHAQVSAETDNGSDEILSVDVAGAVEADLPNCPAGNEVEVNAFTVGTGLANEDFWLALW